MIFYDPDKKLSTEEAIKDVMEKVKQSNESVFALISGVRVVVTKNMDFSEIIHRINKVNAEKHFTVEHFYKKYGK